MKFNEKLLQLRKQKGFTQEEVAELLFVSRTAVSKWESGRGLPNIDSLKAISKVFGISIDELLSGDQIIQAAEEEKKKDAVSLRTILYGLFDLMSLVFLFIPFFGQPNVDFIESVSLLSMESLPNYIFIPYIVVIGVTFTFGVIEITLQNYQNAFWEKNNGYLSMSLTIVATFMFMITQQPYIAFFQFWILITKGVLYIKQH